MGTSIPSSQHAWGRSYLPTHARLALHADGDGRRRIRQQRDPIRRVRPAHGIVSGIEEAVVFPAPRADVASESGAVDRAELRGEFVANAACLRIGLRDGRGVERGGVERGEGGDEVCGFHVLFCFVLLFSVCSGESGRASPCATQAVEACGRGSEGLVKAMPACAGGKRLRHRQPRADGRRGPLGLPAGGRERPFETRVRGLTGDGERGGRFVAVVDAIVIAITGKAPPFARRRAEESQRITRAEQREQLAARARRFARGVGFVELRRAIVKKLRVFPPTTPRATKSHACARACVSIWWRSGAAELMLDAVTVKPSPTPGFVSVGKQSTNAFGRHASERARRRRARAASA